MARFGAFDNDSIMSSGPTISDGDDFFYEIRDDLAEIRDRVQALEMLSNRNSFPQETAIKVQVKNLENSSSGNFKNDAEVQNLHLQIEKMQILILTMQQEFREELKRQEERFKLEISKLKPNVPRLALERGDKLRMSMSIRRPELSEADEWKLFLTEANALQQKLFRTLSFDTKKCCVVIIKNRSNSGLTDFQKWFTEDDTVEYLKMPASIPTNSTESFAFSGNENFVSGLCSCNVQGLKFIFRSWVCAEYDFGIGLFPEDVPLDAAIYKSFAQDLTVRPDRAKEYRESWRNANMEATVTFKSMRGRAMITKAEADPYAVLKILISNATPSTPKQGSNVPVTYV